MAVNYKLLLNSIIQHRWRTSSDHVCRKKYSNLMCFICERGVNKYIAHSSFAPISTLLENLQASIPFKNLKYLLVLNSVSHQNPRSYCDPFEFLHDFCSDFLPSDKLLGETNPWTRWVGNKRRMRT